MNPLSDCQAEGLKVWEGVHVISKSAAKTSKSCARTQEATLPVLSTILEVLLLVQVGFKALPHPSGWVPCPSLEGQGRALNPRDSSGDQQKP